jgi:hypothetical protein
MYSGFIVVWFFTSSIQVICYSNVQFRVKFLKPDQSGNQMPKLSKKKNGQFWRHDPISCPVIEWSLQNDDRNWSDHWFVRLVSEQFRSISPVIQFLDLKLNVSHNLIFYHFFWYSNVRFLDLYCRGQIFILRYAK